MALKYRPEIDGLRALAVFPVILFHAGHPWFTGGFLARISHEEGSMMKEEAA